MPRKVLPKLIEKSKLKNPKADKVAAVAEDAAPTADIFPGVNAGIIMKATRDLHTVAIIVLTTMVKPDKSVIPMKRFAMVTKENINRKPTVKPWAFLRHFFTA